MPLRVTFELSERDLRYFRQCLREVKRGTQKTEEDVITQGAADLVKEVVSGEPPDFVRERMQRLDQLVAMLRDEEWRLTGADRARVLNALAYFVDPNDIIPDRVPGLGYLDDAIMVELVVQELRHEIEAYEDFCDFRKTRRRRDPAALESRRAQLQSRMRRRRRRERAARAARAPRGRAKSPISLW
jgi:uncharacterized membrane protein YkvA (DUF1232 family)